MSEESIGTARIDVTVNTATMEAGVEAAKRRVSGLGNEAAAQFDKANASTKRYADSLLRQADLLGKTRAEQIAYNAQTRIGGELGDKIAAKALANQAKMASSLGGTAKTAKELQFAMRGLPAQISDIFVSLSSGQRPLTVLLQQGSQVKDMFGGLKPAAAALGRSLLGLINPLTLSAAAVAALGAAWVSAEEDASAFNKALIVTGNYAGKTAAQLEGMVDSIAHTADVTQGTAREALQRVAESGRFTGEQFDMVALAAARMQDATGQSIEDTIRKFEDLGKKPVDTLLKLNETEHFLTEAQLERVQALKAEGKEQEAAAEAARIYANRLNEVATAAEAARPALSKMWKEAKEGASGAWDETKKFVDFLSAAAEKYKEMPWYKRISPVGGLSAGLNSLYGAEPPAPVTVKPVAGAINSDEARKAIKAQEDAAKAGSSARSTAQRRDPFADSIGLDPRANLTASIQKEIEGYGKEADQFARSTSAAVAYRQTLADMLDTRQKAIDLQVASIGMGQREIEQQQALIAIDEDYDRKKADLQKRQQNTTSALEREGYQQQLDDLEKYHTQRIQIELDGFKRAEEARKSAALGARAAIADFQDASDDVAGQTYSVWSNSLQGMTDELADFFTTGKANWKDFAQDVLRQIAKIQIAKAVAGIASSFAGNPNTISGYDRATNQQQVAYDVAHGYANGGVFANSPSLSAYSGGVYDKPQMFAFARGAGIFGEAGPEAIMPLRRGPDGKLGVAAAGASGGDVQVEVNITNNGQAVQARQTGTRRDGQKVIVDMVLDAVAGDIASGGKTAKAMQQRFGVQRRGVPVGG